MGFRCTAQLCCLIPSVQNIKRSDHSRKPPEFRAIINRLYPSGARLELFARGEIPPHWQKWGAEVEPSMRGARGFK